MSEVLKHEFTPEEIQQIYADGYADPVFFARFFFPEKFFKPMPWVHRGILAILTRQTDFLLKYGELDKIVRHFVWKEDPDDENAPEHPLFHLHHDEAGNVVAIDLDVTKFTMLMVPRGFSKTTIAGQLVVIWKIVYKETEFTLFVSESGTHSEMQLNNIRAELEGNERLRAVFGNLVPERSDSRKWTGTEIETTSDITVICRGRGGQVRGLNKESRRPDTVLIDDVEDLESVATEEQRKKTRDWAYGDLLPVLPKVHNPGKPTPTIVALGTLLHKEALLMTFLRDPKWTCIVFGALDKDGEPLWEDAMSKEQLEAERNSYSISGTLDKFYLEYMSKLHDEHSAKFKREKFRYISVLPDIIGSAIAMDPAISQSRRADYAGIAVVSMSTYGKIIVRDCWLKRGAEPRELVDQFFQMEAAVGGCQYHGIEAIAYQASLIHLMREEMFRPLLPGQSPRNRFEVIPILHNTSVKKEIRVEGVLQPRLANGYIEFERRFPLLESQLVDWPNGKKDGPDVLAMAISLLDPYAAAAVGDGKDLAEDEQPPLDEVMDGEWRTYQ